MYLRQLILLIGLLVSQMVSAQNTELTAEEVDIKTYQLYVNAGWNELLKYGKEALRQNIDFPYLRLRVAYAAWMLENYSEALKQYDRVLQQNPQNEIALFYSQWCRQKLNHSEMASYYHIPLANLPVKALYKDEEKQRLKCLDVGAEISYKQTDTSSRGSGLFGAAKCNLQIGNRMQLSQAFIFYNQTISEPWLTEITNNTAIDVFQKEYYGKISYAVDRHWLLKGAYHFLYTPFNNYLFYNNVGLLGVKYYGDYYNIQSNIIVAQLSDSMVQQVEVQADYYPAGNLNIYGSTCASLNIQNKQQQFNIKQVLGWKMSSRLWLEANATIGKFNNRFENDAYFVYNAIDPNLYKFGIGAYWYPTAHLQVQIGVTFEKRQLLKSEFIFNQQSINGGITWKF